LSEPLILLYDGVCGFCNRCIQFMLKRDRNDRFRYAPLQSGFAREILHRHGKNPQDFDTVYLVENYGQPDERLIVKGRAGMRVLRELGGAWRVLSWLGVLPRFVLDFGYDLVAGNRYRLFGKSASCPLPSPQDRAKFIAVADPE
jgi:predicted DCC family thiol-disulfide oxidoreductase YuxK